MITTSIPDLLSHNLQVRDNARIRSELARAGQELSSGRIADVMEASGGDPRRLYGLESALTRLEAYSNEIALSEARASASQDALGLLQAQTEEIGTNLLSAVGRNDLNSARAYAASARDGFQAVVATLNSGHSGRSLFSGETLDGAALADANTILNDIATLVAAETTGTNAVLAIEAYFTPPTGGFYATGYLGSTNDAPSAEIATGERIDYAVRADEAEIRAVLESLAIAVMADESALGNDPVEGVALLNSAGTKAINATQAMVDRRAELGIHQARLEQTGTANAAQTTALELQHTAMTSRDPFEAAAEFQALEGQIQSVYTVTARLAGLSLTNFLR